MTMRGGEDGKKKPPHLIIYSHLHPEDNVTVILFSIPFNVSSRVTFSALIQLVLWSRALTGDFYLYVLVSGG